MSRKFCFYLTLFEKVGNSYLFADVLSFDNIGDCIFYFCAHALYVCHIVGFRQIRRDIFRSICFQYIKYVFITGSCYPFKFFWSNTIQEIIFIIPIIENLWEGLMRYSSKLRMLMPICSFLTSIVWLLWLFSLLFTKRLFNISGVSRVSPSFSVSSRIR